MAHTSIRFGIGRFTTDEEVDYAIETCVRHVNRLREMSPLWESEHTESQTLDRLSACLSLTLSACLPLILSSVSCARSGSRGDRPQDHPVEWPLIVQRRTRHVAPPPPAALRLRCARRRRRRRTCSCDMTLSVCGVSTNVSVGAADGRAARRRSARGAGRAPPLRLPRRIGIRRGETARVANSRKRLTRTAAVTEKRAFCKSCCFRYARRQLGAGWL